MNTTKIRKKTKEDWAAFLIGEFLAFALLGKLLFLYPDREWIQSLLAEGVFDELPLDLSHPDVSRGLERLESWSAIHHKSLTHDAFQDLQVDYTRLFIGVDGVLAPPWESVHLSREHLLFQEQTLQVRQWYLRHGLQVVEQDKEPDDHVGLELTFLAHLAAQALSALQDDEDEARFHLLLDAQRNFLVQHPLRWVPKWSQQVIGHAQTDFYRGIGALVNGLLLATAKQLEVPLPQEQGRPGLSFS